MFDEKEKKYSQFSGNRVRERRACDLIHSLFAVSTPEPFNETSKVRHFMYMLFTEVA